MDITDFSNITKGLYSDGNDLYYLLDTGIIATNYMYMKDDETLYFGEDGKMVSNKLVGHNGEKYFFDETGHMIKDRWVTQEDRDEIENTVERTVYYFGPSGRAYRAIDGRGLIIKTIDDEKYGFNEDGKRLTGYVSLDGEELDPESVYAYEDCAYYFDNSEGGAATIVWHAYDGSINTDKYDENKEIYLYFDEKTARKVYYKGNKDNSYLYRTIDGQRYMFDENGVSFFEWYTASSSSPRYYSEDYDGYLTKGWFLAVPSKNSIREKNRNRNADDTEVWFYADRNGNLVRSCLKKIGKYTYAFDEDGVMQENAFVIVSNGKYDRSYDLEDITREMLVYGIDDGGIIGDNEFVLYFLESDNENLSGSMAKTDIKNKIELKDSDIDFIQSNNLGYTAEKFNEAVVRSNRLYQHGVLLSPLNDNKFGIVKQKDNLFKVVNKNGIIQLKSGSYKLASDEYLVVDTNCEYVGAYSCNCRYRDEHMEYKDDNSWIICNKGELPPDSLLVSALSYYINFKIYDGTAAGYID